MSMSSAFAMSAISVMSAMSSTTPSTHDHAFTVQDDDVADSTKLRLDAFLAQRITDESTSRARLQATIKDGKVTVNGKLLKKPSHVVKVGDLVACTIIPPAPLRADPEEVAELCGRLVQDGLVETHAAGITASATGRERSAEVEERANVAMREYVLARPHTATVYGLVAAMQTGRFTVVDLLEFLAEGPSDEDSPADSL